MSVFEFPYSLSEYVDKLKSTIDDSYRSTLNELSTILELRDDDLTSYVNNTATADCMALSRVAVSVGTYPSSYILSWDTQDTSTSSGSNLTWSSTVNPTRVTVGTSSIYLIRGKVTSAGTAGNRYIMLFKNGAEVSRVTYPANSVQENNTEITLISYLAAGDYIELQYYQTNGSNVNVTGNIQISRLGIPDS
jgi:succinate dehydrogenase flavin-adding protein (antitoxin of CptAB toxin-antitoxin module)